MKEVEIVISLQGTEQVQEYPFETVKIALEKSIYYIENMLGEDEPNQRKLLDVNGNSIGTLTLR